MEPKKWIIGVKVRVKPEIEELVKYVSEKTGFQRYTIRNYAIILGLQQIALNGIPFETDQDFLKRFEVLRETIKKALEGGVNG